MGPGAAQPRRRKLASPSKFVYILVTYTRLNTGLMPNCQSPAVPHAHRARAGRRAPLATPPGRTDADADTGTPITASPAEPEARPDPRR